MAFSVKVIRSKRKTMSLEVRRDGTVLVRAPMKTAAASIRTFVEKNTAWIEKQRQKLAAAPKTEALSEQELASLRRSAKQWIPQRAAYFAPIVGVSYGDITIRCQKTKWGSCSSKGNLNFNLLLMLAPPEIVDYVVVHELCHRLEMNHSPRFWANVRRVLPDYERSRRYLREHGAALMARLPAKESQGHR